MSFGQHPGITREQFASLPDRCERFDAGQISADGITMLMQDLIYAGVLWSLPPKFTVAANHCLEMGLCTANGRYLH